MLLYSPPEIKKTRAMARVMDIHVLLFSLLTWLIPVLDITYSSDVSDIKINLIGSQRSFADVYPTLLSAISANIFIYLFDCHNSVYWRHVQDNYFHIS